jgi:aarF domain-containing kinase
MGRIRRVLKYGFGTTAALGVFAGTYDYFNGNVLTRGMRALYNGAKVTYMYKFTTPTSIEELSQMHQRAADALLYTCLKNEGLFIKMGQGVSSLNQILPPEYTGTLKALLDNAPSVPIEDVHAIIKEDLGSHADQLFVSFDPKPVASASIAQVHKAKLRRPDGTVVDVAVKVQKPLIRKQVWWDMLSYHIICAALEYSFQIPLRFSASYIAESFQRELDFRIEVGYMKKTKHFLEGEHGRKDIYVPQVMDELLSPRVMVTEWIDAVKLVETERVAKEFDVTAMVTTLMETFSDMIFDSGLVHCDPHPANVMVRHVRADTNETHHDPASAQHGEQHMAVGQRKHVMLSKPPELKREKLKAGVRQQVVLLDFGLCCVEPDDFRRNYSRLFRAIFMQDYDTLEKIVSSWGFGDAEIFASMQLMKPFLKAQPNTNPNTAAARLPAHIEQKGKPRMSKEEVAAFQAKMKTKISNLLQDEKKVPRELVLVTRSTNILRSINKQYGIPVNRSAIFANRAVAAIAKEAASGAVPDTGRGLAIPREKLAASGLLGKRTVWTTVDHWITANWYQFRYHATLFLLSLYHEMSRLSVKWAMLWEGKGLADLEELHEEREKRILNKHFGFVQEAVAKKQEQGVVAVSESGDTPAVAV